ncbi:hypothetical protein DFH07DRAFT_1029969 [Mycena maculata]|uniref:Zn(2)-C6 fungal-type domain-containing protein n=1 Tax=Mycena maculata TaxID=230809 RepID=A0AAD7J1P5_9AGAR|nr:hypothetical protein DFH07DRAFT_1029969 [Mycena maculata]
MPSAAAKAKSRSDNPFLKRRRASVACITCRKRKIKCITVSNTDDKPCTRCAKNRLECRFIPPDHESISSCTEAPPSESQPLKDDPYRDQPSKAPSASVSQFLGPSRGLARAPTRGSGGQIGGRQRDLAEGVQSYQYGTDPPPMATDSGLLRPRSGSSTPNTYPQMASIHGHNALPTSQAYPGEDQVRPVYFSHNSHGGGFPYNKKYVPQLQVQADDIMYQWPLSVFVPLDPAIVAPIVVLDLRLQASLCAGVAWIFIQLLIFPEVFPSPRVAAHIFWGDAGEELPKDVVRHRV